MSEPVTILQLQSCFASDVQLHLRLRTDRAAKFPPEEIITPVEAAGRLKNRVIDQFPTALRSYFSWTISHREALDVWTNAVCHRGATAETYRAENDNRWLTSSNGGGMNKAGFSERRGISLLHKRGRTKHVARAERNLSAATLPNLSVLNRTISAGRF